MRRPAMVATAIVYSREEAKKPEDNSEEEMEGQFRVTSCEDEPGVSMKILKTSEQQPAPAVYECLQHACA